MNFKARVRLAYDPKVQKCFLIQMGNEGNKWDTLVTFNNENLAKNAFALIKRHGIGVRVLEEIEVDDN